MQGLVFITDRCFLLQNYGNPKSRYEDIYAHCAQTPSWFIHEADPRKTLSVPPEEREAFWKNCMRNRASASGWAISAIS